MIATAPVTPWAAPPPPKLADLARQAEARATWRALVERLAAGENLTPADMAEANAAGEVLGCPSDQVLRALDEDRRMLTGLRKTAAKLSRVDPAELVRTYIAAEAGVAAAEAALTQARAAAARAKADFLNDTQGRQSVRVGLAGHPRMGDPEPSTQE